MKRTLLSLILTGGCLLTGGSAYAQNGPTMGWSSWNTYGVNINEQLIKRQADAMVSKGLKDVGFDHINIDDGFFGGRNTTTGELLIHSTRFPNGLKPLVEYIHTKGLKAGIYSDAGCNTCGNYYNGDTQSVNVGFYHYDQHDADFYFKECGFDFIKVDFCGGDAPQNSQRLALDPQERYTAISQAIKNTGRDDVRMNVCRWNYPGTWVHDVAFSWRTTHDINDSWNSVKGILAENLYLSAYCYDGHYNDMDMLEVGRSMSQEEDKTHFGLWCIMSSPLLIGCDLSNIRANTLNLLKNSELIALNQDTLCLQAYVADLSNNCHILVKDIETLHGNRRAFAVYNPGDGLRKVTVDFSKLDLGGRVKLRDVFERNDLGEYENSFDVIVPTHGTRIYVAEAETRLERTRYEAETGYISDYQELLNNQQERTGIYEAATFCSAGFKAGWLGYSEANDLLWRDVYSVNGGEYDLDIAYISGENRNITVSVNGKEVQTVNVNSGGWQTVGKKRITIHLEKGDNTIRLSNAKSWMPDIDYIELTPNPSAIHQTGRHESHSSNMHDLQGRSLSHAPDKGIYIQDRKKILR
ncbi:MAG: alpha-galactosidase [Prevotella sp.]|nr:alpha-galactosidase [Prevotella sp.]